MVAVFRYEIQIVTFSWRQRPYLGRVFYHFGLQKRLMDDFSVAVRRTYLRLFCKLDLNGLGMIIFG